MNLLQSLPFHGVPDKMTRRFAAVVIASQGLAVFFGALVARAIAAADRQSSASTFLILGSTPSTVRPSRNRAVHPRVVPPRTADRVAAMTERSLVLVKPDGYARGLSGEVLRRIEAKGYTLVALDIFTPDRERLERHYAEHEGKPFYEPLVEFMSSGPVTAAVIEGHRCIEGFRALAGATDPSAALPGTIRGDLGRDWGLKVQQNIVHGSDSEESSTREIAIWFPGLG